VNVFPAATARQVVSNPLAAAPTGAAMERSVELPGEHCGAVGPADGRTTGAGEKARARLPAGGVAMSRSPSGPSYHATARCCASAETAIEGLRPPKLPWTGWVWNEPLPFVAT